MRMLLIAAAASLALAGCTTTQKVCSASPAVDAALDAYTSVAKISAKDRARIEAGNAALAALCASAAAN